jgi:cytidylate kinase
VSAVPEVREALVEKQRAMSRAFNVVMEGRDIGTVVFPEADLKVYLDAEPRVRALRRVADLRAAGVEADAGQVEREMRERDERDRNRQVAPLRQAADAVFLDSSAMTVEEVEEAILKLVRERTSCGKEAVR